MKFQDSFHVFSLRFLLFGGLRIELPNLIGVAAFLDDDRKEVLRQIARYLERNYSQYARGVRYLRQLTGEFAIHRTPAPELSFLISPAALGLQHDIVLPAGYEPHVIHNMRVTFHRT